MPREGPFCPRLSPFLSLRWPHAVHHDPLPQHRPKAMKPADYGEKALMLQVETPFPPLTWFLSHTLSLGRRLTQGWWQCSRNGWMATVGCSVVKLLCATEFYSKNG